MRLLDFEEYIDDARLDRGYAYFTNGHIVNIQRTKKGYYLEIKGTTVYQVIVEISANERITFSSCDCPDKKTPICKHQVAAFYALREQVVKE